MYNVIDHQEMSKRVYAASSCRGSCPGYSFYLVAKFKRMMGTSPPMWLQPQMWNLVSLQAPTAAGIPTTPWLARFARRIPWWRGPRHVSTHSHIIYARVYRPNVYGGVKTFSRGTEASRHPRCLLCRPPRPTSTRLLFNAPLTTGHDEKKHAQHVFKTSRVIHKSAKSRERERACGT